MGKCKAARRRRCGDIVEERRRGRCLCAAGTQRDLGLKAQPHGGCGAISALLIVNDVPASPPPRALSSPRKPHARGLLCFHHGLLVVFIWQCSEHGFAKRKHPRSQLRITYAVMDSDGEFLDAIIRNMPSHVTSVYPASHNIANANGDEQYGHR